MQNTVKLSHSRKIENHIHTNHASHIISICYKIKLTAMPATRSTVVTSAVSGTAYEHKQHHKWSIPDIWMPSLLKPNFTYEKLFCYFVTKTVYYSVLLLLLTHGVMLYPTITKISNNNNNNKTHTHIPV